MNDQIQQRQDAFRQYWHSLVGADDELSNHERDSLRIMAMEDPDLAAVLHEFEPQTTQATLELHLRDGDVVDHSTDAARFGRFVTGFSETVKEISKPLRRKRRLPTTLRASFGPGSVRVTFEAVEPDEPAIDGQGQAHDPTLTAESDALRRVAGVLQAAGSEATDDDLADDLATLPVEAIGKLRSTVKKVYEAGWNIDGMFDAPGTDHVGLSMNQAGAFRIIRATRVESQTTTRRRLHGILDGHRQSVAAVWLRAADDRTYRISVPTSNLMRQVRRLEHLDQPVIAEVEVTTYTVSADSRPRRSTYALVSIDQAAPTMPLPINEQ